MATLRQAQCDNDILNIILTPFDGREVLLKY
jgi:hypothetical protein